MKNIDKILRNFTDVNIKLPKKGHRYLTYDGMWFHDVFFHSEMKTIDFIRSISHYYQLDD